MRKAAAVAALAMAWAQGAALAQQAAPAAAQGSRAQAAKAPAPRAQVRTPAASTAWTLTLGDLEGGPIQPMDSRAVRAARLDLMARNRAAEAALEALMRGLPRGAQIRHAGAELSFIVDGRAVGMTAEQRRLIETYRAARSARDAKIVEISLSTLPAEELTALSSARDAVEAARARNTTRRNARRGSAAAREAQARAQAQAEADRTYRDLLARLAAKARVRAMAEIAPMRIAPDPSLAGREGTLENVQQRTVFRTAPEGRVLFAQDLRFNRGARLTSPLTASLGGRRYTFPTGTEFFVAMTEGGFDAYCLPHVTRAWFTNLFERRPWTPCYVDSDFDGGLDSQRDGGDPIGGTHVALRGFAPEGEVVTPARFQETPASDRFRQRIGVEILENNVSGDEQEIVFGPFIAASDASERLSLSSSERVRLRRGGTAVAHVAGAQIEFRYTGDQRVSYKILEGFPERPFSLEVSE